MEGSNNHTTPQRKNALILTSRMEAKSILHTIKYPKSNPTTTSFLEVNRDAIEDKLKSLELSMERVGCYPALDKLHFNFS